MKTRFSGSKRPISRSRFRGCGLERLEPRELLSAAAMVDVAAQPLAAWRKAARPSALAAESPFTPAQISHAYGFDRLPALSSGAAANGAGQTIAIVDASDAPTLAADVSVFDAAFNLPQFNVKGGPTLTKVNENGGANLPAADPDWAIEIALDVEWAHAMAPGANILLVEAASDNLSDLLAATDTARRSPACPWSPSVGGRRNSRRRRNSIPISPRPPDIRACRSSPPRATGGAPATWPATSPNVLAVGGTSLQTLDAAGTYRSETGWSYGGGGLSLYEPEPSYQLSVQHSGARATPDVAYVADPNTGVYVYNSTGDADSTGWLAVGGTSAGAPQWAAILAVANQGRAALHLAPLCAAPADVYQLAAADFHDVTSGFNGFWAGPGYDLVTGRGTPAVNRLLPDLIDSAGVQASERAAAAHNAATAGLGALEASAASARRLVSRMVVAADLLPPLSGANLAKLRLLEGW